MNYFCFLYCRGVCEVCSLNTLQKYDTLLNPQVSLISPMDSVLLSNSVFAKMIRVLRIYSITVSPVALLKLLQK